MRVYAWKRLHEAMNPIYKQSSVKGDGDDLVIVESLQKPLVKVKYVLTGMIYSDLVADYLHPFILAIFWGGDDLFQQDNATHHHVWVMQNLFQKLVANFLVHYSLLYSADLNPIVFYMFADLTKFLGATTNKHNCYGQAWKVLNKYIHAMILVSW